MNKIKLKLTRSDVKTLGSVLGHMITGTDISTLKKERQTDYLYFACVYDFFHKLDAKNKEIAAFGLEGGRTVSFTLKRHEALALFFLFVLSDEDGEPTYLPAVPDYTANLIRTINSEIHKAFLV